MKIVYNYVVNIKFSRPSKNIVSNISFPSEYYQGNGKRDTITLYSNGITINLQRSRLHSNILNSAQNSINKQIVKALLCYYAISDVFSPIKSIRIKCINGYSELNFSTYNDFLQPLVHTVKPRILSYDLSVLNIIANETEKGKCIRIAISYWLKAMSEDDIYNKFADLWRAFNRIYAYQGNDVNEKNNIINMRGYIIQHSTEFSKTIQTVMKHIDYLYTFRWQKMILNDYPTQKKTGALIEFINRYTDYRIMRLFREKLVCREKFIRAECKWTDVERHINTHLHTISSIEIVTLLAIKYASFIRNKDFHGEIIERTFKIHTDNIDQEIDILNDILSTLIFEIINHHSSLR